jgi:hypothetical protein
VSLSAATADPAAAAGVAGALESFALLWLLLLHSPLLRLPVLLLLHSPLLRLPVLLLLLLLLRLPVLLLLLLPAAPAAGCVPPSCRPATNASSVMASRIRRWSVHSGGWCCILLPGPQAGPQHRQMRTAAAVKLL